MEKEFVPYELSLELKQLGFNEPCFGYRDGIGHLMIKETPHSVISAPTYSQAFRWFREEYNLFGQVNIRTYYIYEISNDSITIKMVSQYDKLLNTYEEAELACLQKLIELVKTK